jgi:hypothetical protein
VKWFFPFGMDEVNRGLNQLPMLFQLAHTRVSNRVCGLTPVKSEQSGVSREGKLTLNYLFMKSTAEI